MHPRPARPTRSTDVALRLAIVALALATGYIHATLGGLLFTLNALGYAAAAAALVVPLGLAVRFRWIVRTGTACYALVTIAAWAVQGPHYETAYVAKAIEVALVVLLAVDFVRYDGNPVSVIRRTLAALVAPGGSRGAGASA